MFFIKKLLFKFNKSNHAGIAIITALLFPVLLDSGTCIFDIVNVIRIKQLLEDSSYGAVQDCMNEILEKLSSQSHQEIKEIIKGNIKNHLYLKKEFSDQEIQRITDNAFIQISDPKKDTPKHKPLKYTIKTYLKHDVFIYSTLLKFALHTLDYQKMPVNSNNAINLSLPIVKVVMVLSSNANLGRFLKGKIKPPPHGITFERLMAMKLLDHLHDHFLRSKKRHLLMGAIQYAKSIKSLPFISSELSSDWKLAKEFSKNLNVKYEMGWDSPAKALDKAKKMLNCSDCNNNNLYKRYVILFMGPITKNKAHLPAGGPEKTLEDTKKYCMALHEDGIEIISVMLDFDLEVMNVLQQCASDGHYYNVEYSGTNSVTAHSQDIASGIIDDYEKAKKYNFIDL
ncbi:hypothetical protein B488_06480 [Liberibacter crescens BT-1]|uniref:VWFA domain-containing protein n=1 Tax=Liberibacter crescens (strain BT-1) TaxID=1215343 RepID=L0EUX4_LIBCB|nr:hypothetical protein [Liberibacter crescens]AGA64640.1 hypothetical protein B488_06480 [Liberibacter crescens BT-1]AMC12753.1 hypothetical protein RL73_03355 [Liberibacter crescens]